MEFKGCGGNCGGSAGGSAAADVPALLRRLRVLVDRLEDGAAKHNPNWALQPRVPVGSRDGGQWTAGGPQSFSDHLRTGVQPVSVITQEIIRGLLERGHTKNPYPNDPECKKEWDNAKILCLNLMQTEDGDLSNVYGGDIFACMRGQVSERCGGNPIEPPPKRPPYSIPPNGPCRSRCLGENPDGGRRRPR